MHLYCTGQYVLKQKLLSQSEIIIDSKKQRKSFKNVDSSFDNPERVKMQAFSFFFNFIFILITYACIYFISLFRMLPILIEKQT